MKIVWSASARRDLDQAYSYLFRESPSGADLVEDRVLAALKLLESYPHLGRAIDESGRRQLAVAKTKYKLIYRVGTRNVHLLRVLHGAQQWP